MNCPKCGNPIPHGCTNCIECGAPVANPIDFLAPAAPAPVDPYARPGGWTIISLLFGLPVGLLVMWAKSGWPENVKIPVTCVLGPVAALLWLCIVIALWQCWWKEWFENKIAERPLIHNYLRYAKDNISGVVVQIILLGAFVYGLLKWAVFREAVCVISLYSLGSSVVAVVGFFLWLYVSYALMWPIKKMHPHIDVFNMNSAVMLSVSVGLFFCMSYMGWAFFSIAANALTDWLWPRHDISDSAVLWAAIGSAFALVTSNITSLLEKKNNDATRPRYYSDLD